MSELERKEKHDEETEEEKEQRKKDNAKIMNTISLASRLCVAMPLCIVVGFFAGKFLDNFFGTGSIFLLVFIIFGIIASYTTLYKAIKK